MMKLYVLLLLFLVGPTQPLYAAIPLTLDETQDTALKNHPQIIEAKENLNGTEARTGQAVANYYPLTGEK